MEADSGGSEVSSVRSVWTNDVDTDQPWQPQWSSVHETGAGAGDPGVQGEEDHSAQ